MLWAAFIADKAEHSDANCESFTCYYSKQWSKQLVDADVWTRESSVVCQGRFNAIGVIHSENDSKPRTLWKKYSSEVIEGLVFSFQQLWVGGAGSCVCEVKLVWRV